MNPQQPTDPNQQGQPQQQSPAPQQWPAQSPMQTPPPPTPQAGVLPSAQPENQATPANPQSPYGFIMQDAQQSQPSGTFGLGGKATKLLALVIGAAIVVIIIGVLVATLSPKSAAEKLYVTLTQDQQEIVRVAALGVSASGEESKAFALNTQVSIASDQQTLVQYLANSGVKIDKKQLALKKDTKTDATLNNAKATNTFDSALSDTLITSLEAYRTDIQAAYKETGGKAAQQMLNEEYAHVQLLLKQAGVDTNAAATTTN